MRCKIVGCTDFVKSKNLCAKHYIKDYYKLNPEKYTEKRTKARDRRKERYKNDPVYREKMKEYQRTRAKKYFKEKCKIDPEWNARRQREHRERNPQSFNFTMAKYYFNKLTAQQREKLRCMYG